MNSKAQELINSQIELEALTKFHGKNFKEIVARILCEQDFTLSLRLYASIIDKKLAIEFAKWILNNFEEK